MIKITLKGAGLGEKPKILVDNNVVDKVSIHKPTTLNLERGKHTLQLKNVNGKSIPIEIEVSDETKEYIYNVDLSKTFAEGYFKLVSPINNTDTNFTMTNNEDYMYCSKCGTKISKESTFCNKCGNKIEQLCQTEKSKIQNSKVESNQVETTDNGKPDWTKIISGIVGLIIMVVGLWNIYGGNGVDGEYWFSDGSGYVKINKDINRIYFYDEYNSAKGTTSVKFTDNKTFVYSDGLLEYTGTINGKKLTVECENDKMGGYEATKK